MKNKFQYIKKKNFKIYIVNQTYKIFFKPNNSYYFAEFKGNVKNRLRFKINRIIILIRKKTITVLRNDKRR